MSASGSVKSASGSSQRANIDWCAGGYLGNGQLDHRERHGDSEDTVTQEDQPVQRPSRRPLTLRLRYRLGGATLDERTWTLLRDQPDFTPLNFSQRFTGTFDANGTSITATWETSDDGEHWRKDFGLTYTRRPGTSGAAAGHESTDSP